MKIIIIRFKESRDSLFHEKLFVFYNSCPSAEWSLKTMQDIYNLGDDSDSDEDEDEEIEVVSSVSKTKSWQPQDIEKVCYNF